TDPAHAEPGLAAILALVPSIVAGIVLFRLVAVEMLGIAVATAVAGYAALRLRDKPQEGVPLLPSLVGVALVGPGAPLGRAAGVGLVAVGVDVWRGRPPPRGGVQAGLVAYVLVGRASEGGTAACVKPGGTTLGPEPLRLWLRFFGGAQAPLDPVRLYVGNVAG